MELAQLAYVAGHFPVNVVNTLVHNFELSANVFKTFHVSNWAGNSCLTAFSFSPLEPSRSCWPRGSCRSWRPLKALKSWISFFTLSRFQIKVPPFYSMRALTPKEMLSLLEKYASYPLRLWRFLLGGS